jgi:hypothetical protein
MARQFTTRRASMKFTDRRAKILLEVLSMQTFYLFQPSRPIRYLGSMRVVKYFCYEVPFLKRDFSCSVYLFRIDTTSTGIFEIREDEIRGVRKIQHSNSAK